MSVSPSHPSPGMLASAPLVPLVPPDAFEPLVPPAPGSGHGLVARAPFPQAGSVGATPIEVTPPCEEQADPMAATTSNASVAAMTRWVRITLPSSSIGWLRAVQVWCARSTSHDRVVM